MLGSVSAGNNIGTHETSDAVLSFPFSQTLSVCWTLSQQQTVLLLKQTIAIDMRANLSAWYPPCGVGQRVRSLSV